MSQMLAGKIEQEPYVLVVQAVVHHSTAAPGLYDLRGPQQPQCMGDRGLGHLDGRGEVADTELARFEQCVQYPRAACIAEKTKKLGQRGCLLEGQQPALCLRDTRAIDRSYRTAVQPGDL